MGCKVVSILFLMIISSCQSLSIHDVEKKKFLAGRPDQPILVKYSATINVINTVTLQAIDIEDATDHIDFSLIRLPDGLVKGANTPLEAGSYYLEASTKFNAENFAKDETLIFHFLDALGESITIKKEVATIQKKSRK